MDDYKQKVGDYKEKADEYKDKLMSKATSIDQKGKFFTFSKPFTNMIDDGTLFTKYAGIIYQLIGGLLLLFPVYVAYLGFDNDVFDGKFKEVIVDLIFFSAFSISCWVSFQILFNRKDQFKDLDRSKGYIATAIASNFIRTAGESMAVFVAAIGAPMAILALIFDHAEDFIAFWLPFSANLASFLPADGFGNDYANVFYFPVAAFCILVQTRFISELMNAIVEIVRNTKR